MGASLSLKIRVVQFCTGSQNNEFGTVCWILLVESCENAQRATMQLSFFHPVLESQISVVSHFISELILHPSLRPDLYAILNIDRELPLCFTIFFSSCLSIISENSLKSFCFFISYSA